MKISICISTYNHKMYIAEALESVAQQVTTFTKEVLIGDDFSTDGTRDICKDYAEKYPGLFKLIPAEKNIGMMQNFLRTLKVCDGKYIAFLEGDDFWTDPYKLQKQVDFLEANEDFCACFHNVLVKSTINNIVGERVFHKELKKNTFETEDLLGAWFVPSASVVFVNYADFILPDWFTHCKSGDVPFLLLLSLKGKLKYLNEIMSVYRTHDKGISASHNGYDKIIAMIFIYENFNIYTNYKFRNKIKEAIIYEIDRHLPKNNITKSVTEKPDLVLRIYNKLKGALITL